MKKKEEIEKLRQQLSDANEDINRTNMSLKNLAEINNRVKSLEQEYNTTAKMNQNWKIIINLQTK